MKKRNQNLHYALLLSTFNNLQSTYFAFQQKDKSNFETVQMQGQYEP